MSKQLPLFELAPPRWVNRLWRQLGPETRREVLSILAEMARGSLVSGRAAQEPADES